MAIPSLTCRNTSTNKHRFPYSLPRKAKDVKKYQTYKCQVDPDQDDRATEIKMCDFSRPHMRAFHCNWISFFMAFCIWSAIVPLLTEIKKPLHLNKQQIWTSSIVGVSGTIFVRFVFGPLMTNSDPAC